MFHVKIRVSMSAIHGLGLFADEDIPKGKVVYTINPALDLKVSQKEFKKLSADERQTIEKYGYCDKKDGAWHLAFDDIRFCNHRLESNISLKDGSLVALRRIKKGEELVQNYEEFETLRKELT